MISSTHGNVINFFIVCELKIWSRDLHTHVIVKGCLFGAVKLTKNDDPNKYSYSDMVLYSIHHHYF